MTEWSFILRYDAIAVYIMTNRKNGPLYIGVTSDLIARVYQHKNGITGGFTQRYGLHSLIYYELHATMEAAIHREKRLKKYTREQKVRLIEIMNPGWDDLYETIL
jgi:putative endonuclease